MSEYNPDVRNRVAYITLAWMITGFIQTSYEWLVVKSYGMTISLEDFIALVITGVIAGLVSGVTGGYILVKVTYPWFSKYPFGRVLFHMFVWFTAIFFLVVFIMLFLNVSIRFGFDFWVNNFSDLYADYFLGVDIWKQYVFWVFITLVTMVSLFVSDKYGPGVFGKFLMGKYFSPKRENRIFMFLDLRGSTAIAEQIGEEKYFNFFSEFIDDVTPAILKHKGEIYQYVGDEVIVSWPLKTGLKKWNCIDSYFSIVSYIGAKEKKYQDKFDVVPSFKAGLHCGEAMVGEIGKVKRDISYSGDVLNTSARIQGKCNQHHVDILVSEKLINLLPGSTKFQTKKVGDILLRGKKESTALFTIEV